MTQACIACKHLQIKQHPKHAAVGLGRCVKGPPAYFVSVGRVKPCATFEAAPADRVEARRVWFLQRR